MLNRHFTQHHRRRCRRCWMPCLRSSAWMATTSLIKTMMATTSTSLKGSQCDNPLGIQSVKTKELCLPDWELFFLLQRDLQHFRASRWRREAGELLRQPWQLWRAGADVQHPQGGHHHRHLHRSPLVPSEWPQVYSAFFFFTCAVGFLAYSNTKALLLPVAV